MRTNQAVSDNISNDKAKQTKTVHIFDGTVEWSSSDTECLSVVTKNSQAKI